MIMKIPFCFEHQIAALRSYYFLQESIYDAIIYSKEITTRHLSRDDAGHLIWQRARRITFALYSPFVCRVTRLSKYATFNANVMI
jgi:hypothetical protein